jgi:hypothetical protein
MKTRVSSSSRVVVKRRAARARSMRVVVTYPRVGERLTVSRFVRLRA